MKSDEGLLEIDTELLESDEDLIELEIVEQQIRLSFLENVTEFFKDTGNVYSFVAAPYFFDVNGKECLINLVLYHRKLRSLIAFEFDTTCQSKMASYLPALDKSMCIEGENPSIGISICNNNGEMAVKYFIREQEGIYKTMEQPPKELEGILPDVDQCETLCSLFVF